MVATVTRYFDNLFKGLKAGHSFEKAIAEHCGVVLDDVIKNVDIPEDVLTGKTDLSDFLKSKGANVDELKGPARRFLNSQEFRETLQHQAFRVEADKALRELKGNVDIEALIKKYPEVEASPEVSKAFREGVEKLKANAKMRKVNPLKQDAVDKAAQKLEGSDGRSVDSTKSGNQAELDALREYEAKATLLENRLSKGGATLPDRSEMEAGWEKLRNDSKVEYSDDFYKTEARLKYLEKTQGTHNSHVDSVRKIRAEGTGTPKPSPKTPDPAKPDPKNQFKNAADPNADVLPVSEFLLENEAIIASIKRKGLEDAINKGFLDNDLDDVLKGDVDIITFLKKHGADTDNLSAKETTLLKTDDFKRYFESLAFNKEFDQAVNHNLNFDFNSALSKYPRLAQDSAFVRNASTNHKALMASRDVVSKNIVDECMDLQSRYAASPESLSKKELRLLKKFEASYEGPHPDTGLPLFKGESLKKLNQYFIDAKIEDGIDLPKFSSSRPTLRTAWRAYRTLNTDVVKNPVDMLRIMPWRMPMDSKLNIRRVVKASDAVFNKNGVAKAIVGLQEKIENIAKSVDDGLDPKLAHNQVKVLLEDFATNNKAYLKEMEQHYALQVQAIQDWPDKKKGFLAGISPTAKTNAMKHAADMQSICKNLQNPTFGIEGAALSTAKTGDDFRYGLNRVHALAFMSDMRTTGIDPRTKEKALAQYVDALERQIDSGTYSTKRTINNDGIPFDIANLESGFDVKMLAMVKEMLEKGSDYWNVPHENTFAELAQSLIEANMEHELMFMVNFAKGRIGYSKPDAWQTGFVDKLKKALDNSNPRHMEIFKKVQETSNIMKREGGGKPGFLQGIFGSDTWGTKNWKPFETGFFGASGGRYLEQFASEQDFIWDLMQRYRGNKLFSTPFKETIRSYRQKFYSNTMGYVTGGFKKLDDKGLPVMKPDDKGKATSSYEFEYSRKDKNFLGSEKLGKVWNSKPGTALRIPTRIFFAPEYAAWKLTVAAYKQVGNPLYLFGAGALLAVGAEEFVWEPLFSKDDDDRGTGLTGDLGSRGIDVAISALNAPIKLFDVAVDTKTGLIKYAADKFLNTKLDDDGLVVGAIQYGGFFDISDSILSGLHSINQRWIGDRGEMKYGINGPSQVFNLQQEYDDFNHTFSDIDTLIDVASTDEERAWLQDIKTYRDQIDAQFTLYTTDIGEAGIAHEKSSAVLKKLLEDKENKVLSPAAATILDAEISDAQAQVSIDLSKLNSAVENSENFARNLHITVSAYERLDALEKEASDLEQYLERSLLPTVRDDKKSELKQVHKFISQHNTNASAAVLSLANLSEEQILERQAKAKEKAAAEKAAAERSAGAPAGGTTGAPPATGAPQAGNPPQQPAAPKRKQVEQADLYPWLAGAAAQDNADNGGSGRGGVGDLLGNPSEIADQFRDAVGGGLVDQTQALGMDAWQFGKDALGALGQNKNPFFALIAASLAMIFAPKLVPGTGAMSKVGKFGVGVAAFLGVWAAMRPRAEDAQEDLDQASAPPRGEPRFPSYSRTGVGQRYGSNEVSALEGTLDAGRSYAAQGSGKHAAGEFAVSNNVHMFADEALKIDRAEDYMAPLVPFPGGPTPHLNAA